MKRSLLLSLSVLPLIACGAATPDETGSSSDSLVLNGWIDFDQSAMVSPFFPYRPPPPVSNGTIIDGLYSPVTFSCVACASGHAYARFMTSSNGVSLFPAPYVPFFDAQSGAVKAEFATPRAWVSIDALPVLLPEYLGTPIAKPFLQGFDANGKHLMTVYYPYAYGDPQWGTWQTLTVSDPGGAANIKYVLLSSQYKGPSVPRVAAAFDNLMFNGDPPVVFEKPPVRLRPFP